LYQTYNAIAWIDLYIRAFIQCVVLTDITLYKVILVKNGGTGLLNSVALCRE